MARKKRLIVPVFIPFGGCTHRCVFCEQERIAGEDSMPGPEEVAAKVELYLSTWRGTGRREVAFYGGSFTALPAETQREYLEAVKPFVSDGRINGVRVSTRPDSVRPATPAFLSPYGVDTVELGVQSLDDRVLALSGRGHTREDTVSALEVLKGAGLTTGVQVMPGLPGDTVETFLAGVEELCRLGPDIARIYPTLVIRGTPLERLHAGGGYEPWDLETTVAACARALGAFEAAGVRVIRVGLQPTAELEGSLVAGPYHPSIRQLVEAELGGAGPKDLQSGAVGGIN